MRDPNIAPDEGQGPQLGNDPRAPCWAVRIERGNFHEEKARARRSVSRILSGMDRSPHLGDHFSGIRVAPNLKRPTREPRPGQSLRRILTNAPRVLLFGLAPGDAYRASDVTIPAVGSYPAVSPLPDPLRLEGIPSHWPSAVCFLWCRCRIAPPGSYPAPRPWSPDFPPGTQDAERSPSLLSRAAPV